MKIFDFPRGLFKENFNGRNDVYKMLLEKKFTKISDNTYRLRDWTVAIGEHDDVTVMHGNNGNGMGDVFDYVGALQFLEYL